MAALNVQFQVEVLGDPDQFLGVKLKRPSSMMVALSQQSYIEGLLHRIAMEET